MTDECVQGAEATRRAATDGQSVMKLAEQAAGQAVAVVNQSKAGAGRAGGSHRPDQGYDRPDPRDCRPDQSAGAECGHRIRPRRRERPRLCRGGRRSAQAGGAYLANHRAHHQRWYSTLSASPAAWPAKWICRRQRLAASARRYGNLPVHLQSLLRVADESRDFAMGLSEHR